MPPVRSKGGQAPGALDLWLNLAVISGTAGSSFLFIKLIGNSLPVFAFAASRGFVAMTALLVFLALRRLLLGRTAPRTGAWRDLRHMLVLGTTNGWLANALIAVAVRHVDTAVVAMIQAAVPLFVAIMAHFLFYEERFRSGQLVGILTGLGGIVLIIGPLALLGSHGSLIGVSAMLLTALLYACGLVYARGVAHENPVALACGQQACGAVIAGAIAFLFEPAAAFGNAVGVWPYLVVLGVLCSAVPTALLLRLVRRAPSVSTAMIAYLQPAWASLLGVLVLLEPVHPRGLLGTAMIVAGVMIVTGRPKQGAVAVPSRASPATVATRLAQMSGD